MTEREVDHLTTEEVEAGPQRYHILSFYISLLLVVIPILFQVSPCSPLYCSLSSPSHIHILPNRNPEVTLDPLVQLMMTIPAIRKQKHLLPAQGKNHFHNCIVVNVFGSVFVSVCSVVFSFFWFCLFTLCLSLSLLKSLLLS